MPAFTYSGDSGRYYPDLNGGVVLNDGDSVTVDADPGDGRFIPASSSSSKGSSLPAPSVPAEEL